MSPVQSGSPVEQELAQRILWFIRLRWLAVVGTLITVLVGDAVFRFGVPLVPVTGVLGFIALYNAVCHLLAHRVLPRDSTQASRWCGLFANVQISLDLVTLTLLLHYSGGVENPFAFYFIFHQIIASILLSVPATYLQAALAIVLFNGMAFYEVAYPATHVHLSNFLPMELNGTIYALVIQAVFTTTIVISVYMATSITQKLRAQEHEVYLLSVQLSEQNEKLQQALDVLSYTQNLQVQYMRKVSHELRSPLGAVESMLTLITRKIVTDRQKTDELIERSVNRIKGLLRMLDDLLALLRSRSSTLEEQFQPVDIQSVADKVVDLLTARAQNEKVELCSFVQPALPPLVGDAQEIEQLMTNLVANGIKYTPEGGRVQLTVSSHNGEILIQVSDTGIGIDEADMPRLFNEFFRAKNAREFNPVGTGLGLSIVRSIVDAHKGRIEVESLKGKGTTFRVFLRAANGKES